MNPFHNDFALDPSIAYLNHAAVSPWPKRTALAVQQFAATNMLRGASDYPEWLKVEDSLRTAAARLLNAPSVDDISLLKNTSEGLSLVAHGLDWRAGDNVVSYACEFPSNRVVWESLSAYGVEARQVELQEDAEAALLAACDDRTRLISVSSVQYADGFRSDLPRIGAFCRQQGILFCVDAIQSIGAMRSDVQAWQADFVVADGHKWMLGPEGLAIFYSRPEVRERLQLRQYGWHMLAQAGDYNRRNWTAASSGVRFECGSPNLLAAHALNASLGLLLENGMAEIEQQVLTHTRSLQRRLGEIAAVELLSSTLPERLSGIVTFRPTKGDPVALYRHLMSHGVICAPRGGGVRLSPHYYTPEAALDTALEQIQVWLAGQPD